MNKENYEYKVVPNKIKCKVESAIIKQNIQKPELSDSVIKSMMLMYKHSGSKEMRNIISIAGKVSSDVSEIFEKVLISTKLSNKESLFFFEIIGQFPEWLEDKTVNCVTEYRFATQDKYLDRLVVEYFRLILEIYDRLSHEQLVETYYKFIYLFENGICENMVIYRLFNNFLNRGMVSLFLYKRGYMKMRFLKEFLVDFRNMEGVLIRIGYEIPETRGLVYSLVSGSLESSWVLQRWKVYDFSGLTIAGLFYACDIVYFMKNMGLRQMELAGDLHDILKKELQTAASVCTNTFWCTNKTDSKCSNDSNYTINECSDNANSNNKTFSIDYAMERKKKFQEAVMHFNEKGELAENYTAVEMYISPMVDLGTLGRFLCNYKHLNELKTFIGAFCFRGMDLLDALRLFMNGFCLVGEAQIVERVVGLFVETYLAQNSHVEECLEVATEYRNLGYSFLALNTMLHNAAVDKKPSFEDYLRMVGFSEDFFTKKETLREYYVSVKENEIKYPDQWHDSYDKYLMTIGLRKKFFQEIINKTNRKHNDSASNSTTISLNNSDKNITNTTALPSTNSIFNIPSNSFKLCKACILAAYKTLFKKTFSRFYSMDPTDFYELCFLIGDQDIYEAYVRHQSVACKNNVVIIFNCWRHLLENYVLRDKTLLPALVSCVNKIENVRESIFRDLSLLSVRSTHNTRTDADSRDSILGSVNPLYLQPVQALVDIHFATSQICCANTIFLCNVKNDLINKILVHLIIKHINWVTNLEEYPAPIRNSVIVTCPNSITSLSPLNKLDYLCSKKNLSAADFEIYTSCRIPCLAGFELFCRFQREYDIFDDYITIRRSSEGVNDNFNYHEKKINSDKKEIINITNNITNDDSISNNSIKFDNITNINAERYAPFFINEFYKEQLLIPKNALKLFKTSSTLLNPAVASAVHRPSASHEKVAYLLIKTDILKTPLFDHFTTIIESLTNCLPLFIDIVNYIYPLLYCISSDTRSIFLRILITRFKKYKKNCVACCEEKKPPLSEINKIVERLVADNFIKKDAFSLFSKVNVFEI